MSAQDTVRKLLIVDDEPEVAIMFRQRMRREVRSGIYELLFAESGLEALEVLEQNPDVRLVLTDLNMPRMDGLALLDALCEDWPEVRSIVVSAYGDAVNKDKASERGASGFVVKPVDFPELKEMLVSSLD